MLMPLLSQASPKAPGPDPCTTFPPPGERQPGDAGTAEMPPSVVLSAAGTRGTPSTSETAPGKQPCPPGQAGAGDNSRRIAGLALTHAHADPAARCAGTGAPSGSEPAVPRMALRQPKSLSVCAQGCAARSPAARRPCWERRRDTGGEGGNRSPLAPSIPGHTLIAHRILKPSPSTRSESQSHASGARSPQGPGDVSTAPAPSAAGRRDAALPPTARRRLRSRETEAQRGLWQRESLAELLHRRCSRRRLCPRHPLSAVSRSPEATTAPLQTACPDPAHSLQDPRRWLGGVMAPYGSPPGGCT